MSKIPIITTVSAVALAALFAILRQYWLGLTYFVFGCFLLLALFWAFWLIFLYFTKFKEELSQQFEFYRAQKINSGAVTAEMFDAAEKEYKKQFSRTVFKDKLFKWSLIIFCFGLVVLFLMGMIYYKP